MAVAVASMKMAHKEKGLSTDFVQDVHDHMMASLQSAARECVNQAAKQFNEEMARLQAERQQEVLDLKQQLKVLSECQRVMISQNQRTGHDGALACSNKPSEEPAQPRSSQSPPRCVAVPGMKNCPEFNGRALASPPGSACPAQKLASSCEPADSGSAPISMPRGSRIETFRELPSLDSETLLAQTPARHITLVMTPTSSQTCSSSECGPSSPSSCAKALPTGSSSESQTPAGMERSSTLHVLPDVAEVVNSTLQHPADTKLPPPVSPSKQHRTALLAEVTPPPRVPPPVPACEKSKYGRPLQFGGMTCSDQAVATPAENSNALDRTTQGKVDCMSSPPLPVESPLATPQREHVRASPRVKPSDDVKVVPNERGGNASNTRTTPAQEKSPTKLAALQGNASIPRTPLAQEKSPTALEPDTIDVLRAALVDTFEQISCTPKPSPSRGPVLLPPAALQGRHAGNSCESNLPTPQGSPIVRPAFDTPRGSNSTTARQPVRTPKLSHLFNTPGGAGASTQASASAQDAQVAPITSPARPNSDLKSRRLSWPSTPKNPVRAVVAAQATQQQIKEAPEGDDSASASHRNANIGAAEMLGNSSEQAAGGSKLQAIAPTAMPEVPPLPKTMPGVDQADKSGIVDGASLHGVASPLRRRWLGVLNAAPSTSAVTGVTPKPPAQRLDVHRE